MVSSLPTDLVEKSKASATGKTSTSLKVIVEVCTISSLLALSISSIVSSIPFISSDELNSGRIKIFLKCSHL